MLVSWAQGVGRAATWIVLGLVVGGCSSGAQAQPGAVSGVPGNPDEGTGEGSGEGTSGSSTGATTLVTSGSSGLEDTSSSVGGAANDSTSTGSTQTGPQTFDVDPGWASFNLPLGGNDYGWRPTATAGGEPGEICGFFQAPAENSYYADVGAITLTLEGQGVESYDLSAEDRVAIESLDAFGFATRISGNAGVDTGLLEAYIDDVEYTR